ncbi:GGDEF domain-containing protein [Gilvimarinus sp. DA14]|uniref:GGDEF domain-containing protein n=1 Tax=Gilvimarinus sp. DA14 TaxID=2956798 RepID=UPI0020B82C36|nr:GGDEF domain-containing protein [Gilvimarinus sp. DA14]UTF58645.1 GGDEF domain-containing protein [Gilvimarinus sp. DA14]
MIRKLREEFRQTMAILLSCCAILAISILAVVRALSDQWLIAALDTAIVLGITYALWHQLVKGQSSLTNFICACFYTLAGLGMSYLNPQPMIYWLYPIAIANFFLLPLRQAGALNLFAGIVLLPLSVYFSQQLEFVDMLVSWVLVCAFSGIFAWKTDDQHHQLEQWAHLDTLTGIGNRRKLFSRLSEQPHEPVCSVLLLDLDHFKAINDQHGHEVGDHTLQSVSQLIHSRLRSGSDEVFRYGGEEFLILLHNTDLPGASLLADSLRQQIQQQLSVTASIGCAQKQLEENWQELIKRADAELYKAKSAGRNCVRPAPGTTSGERENADALL